VPRIGYEETRARVGMNGWATLVVFLPPALLLFTVFVFLPMAEASWYSFFNWDGLGPLRRFIALKNYRWVFENPVFLRAVFNNALVILVSLAIQLPLALGVALMVAGKAWGSVAFRMIFFLPYVLADVVAGLIWRFLFDGDYGLVAAITHGFGMQPVYLLASDTWAFTAVLAVVLWKYFGFHMMLYVAGLQSVDKSLLEAAEMDGANAWQRFWHVTLPALGPMIRLSIFFAVVGSLQLFDVVAALTRGGPFDSTHTMVSFIYYFGVTRMRVGFGAAVGDLLFLICVAFAIGYNRWVTRDD
jgi:raffinose/stachyose/melibiose transport system permease protein